MTEVLSYGGGVQTVAMCVLVAKGILSRPDRIVMADTGREVRSTFAYLDTHVRPLLAPLGLDAEVAPHALATVDLYGKNGDLLLPAFTATGKLPTFCSNEWKTRAVERHLRMSGVTSADLWIGFTLEERERVKAKQPGPWQRTYPLLDLMLTRSDCLRIIADAGLPEPKKSRCWMCPHQSGQEWDELRRNSPEEWAKAVALDEEIREADERGGVYLHRTLVPLAEADLDADMRNESGRQCGLGWCFI